VDVVHPRCAGVDISKRDAKVCVRIAGPGRAKANIDGYHLGSGHQPDSGPA